MAERRAALGVRPVRAGTTRDNAMTILGGVPVRTRLPVSAWAFAALVSFFSLMLSLISAGETGQISNASMDQLASFFHAF
jgi:hypothetical protein